jgi:hypothetical protein
MPRLKEPAPHVMQAPARISFSRGLATLPQLPRAATACAVTLLLAINAHSTLRAVLSPSSAIVVEAPRSASYT